MDPSSPPDTTAATAASLSLSPALKSHDGNAHQQQQPPPPPRRTPQKRASERLSRQRRSARRVQLEASVALLERVALVLPLIGDPDGAWDEFLDDETKRVRATLRQLGPATEAVRTLLAQRNQLQKLLVEHELASRAFTRLLAKDTSLEPPVDDWDTNLQKWQQLARQHFRPWTHRECLDEVDTAVQEAYRFAFSRDKQRAGYTFLGWEASRRIDAAASAVQFSFEKTFLNYDLDLFASTIRRTYLDSALFSQVVLGSRGRGAVHVLQELTPTLSIVLYHERYTDMPVDCHSVILLATVETDEGVTLFMRWINTPELMGVIGGRDDLWISKFYWAQFDVLDRKKPRSACDYRLALRGSLGMQDPAVLNMWLFEVLGSLLRSEAFASQRPLLTF